MFRASTPLVICILDWWFLGRELPNAKSWMALGGLLLGAACYVLTDSSFAVTGYSWVCIWFVVFACDQVYIKHAVETVKMQSNWGRVYYTNLMAAVPLIFVSGSQELETLTTFEWSSASVGAVAVSCCLGVAMSYFSFLCRKIVSATMFTVIGNCCKICTVLINLLIWEHHANAYGLSALFVCLGFAYCYKQSPLRPVLAR